MKVEFHRDAFRRVDYLLVSPIENKGRDLDQTPGMKKKKKKILIYNCTLSAVFIWTCGWKGGGWGGGGGRWGGARSTLRFLNLNFKSADSIFRLSVQSLS